MTTIRQLIQNGPAKANELFAKLGDTSDTAVKTRERLFAELKEEVELLARLEEEHIFPVLRKNKKTKGLVPDALNDNKLTRKLLVQLEEMPKDGDEFTDGLAELRRTFQQHVRDEKKELLPAVLKALSDEEPKRSSRASRTRRPKSRRQGVPRPNSAGPLPVKSASRPKTCDRLPKASPRRWQPRLPFRCTSPGELPRPRGRTSSRASTRLLKASKV